MIGRIICVLVFVLSAVPSFAQSGSGRVTGRVGDETGAALPGVTIELRGNSGNTAAPMTTVSGGSGEYTFEGVTPGTYQLSFTLINFASATHRDLQVAAGQTATDNEVLHLSLNAEVVVMGKRTFTNLADVEDPAEDLVGIASSASQGAITARQLEVRPFMRQGEVLETVPGVIITQHAARGRRTSTSCAASTSIMAATSP